MADPLSIAASIAGLYTLTTTLLSTSQKTLSALSSEPSELQDLITSLTTLRLVIGNITDVNAAEIAAPLGALMAILEELEKKVYGILIGKGERGEMARRVVMVWKLKKEEIRSVLERLERAKADLGLALLSSQRKQATSQQRTMEDVLRATQHTPVSLNQLLVLANSQAAVSQGHSLAMQRMLQLQEAVLLKVDNGSRRCGDACGWPFRPLLAEGQSLDDLEIDLADRANLPKFCFCLGLAFFFDSLRYGGSSRLGRPACDVQKTPTPSVRNCGNDRPRACGARFLRPAFRWDDHR